MKKPLAQILRILLPVMLAAVILFAAAPAKAGSPIEYLAENRIQWLQQALNSLGYDVECTGMAGGATEEALAAFSRDHGLGERIMASSAAWNTLMACLSDEYGAYLSTLGGQDGTQGQFYGNEIAARKLAMRNTGLVRGLSAGELVAAYAQTFVGVPYKWGKANPDVGFDCSGLVWYVYRHFNQTIPRSTNGMDKVGQPVASMEDAKPGDILCFGRPVHHVGLYIGDNKMIHAPQRNTFVIVVEMDRTPSYIRRIYN